MSWGAERRLLLLAPRQIFDHADGERRPPGLMTGAHAASRVAVKIFVKKIARAIGRIA